MDPTVRARTGLSGLDGSLAAHPVAGRARDPGPTLAHVCCPARVRSGACREAPGACDAAFPGHTHCLPHRLRCAGRLALSDREHDHRAGHLALRLCAIFADPRQEWSAHAPGTDLAVIWHLTESD